MQDINHTLADLKVYLETQKVNLEDFGQKPTEWNFEQGREAAEPSTPRGLASFVTVQHFEDGLRAGFEGMARVTATHLSKLEQRVAAVESSAVIQTRAPGGHITSMTGLTRLIQGRR